jgi:hypothetical protein
VVAHDLMYYGVCSDFYSVRMRVNNFLLAYHSQQVNDSLNSVNNIVESCIKTATSFKQTVTYFLRDTRLCMIIGGCAETNICSLPSATA